MSLETWKQEYYSVPATEFKCGSNLLATDHSLRKWRGLRSDVLARHGLLRYGNEITDAAFIGPTFHIDGGTCALCQKHAHGGRWVDSCFECPLWQARAEPGWNNGVRCDLHRAEEKSSPYGAIRNGDPEPMIMWLEKAMELQLKKDGK